MVSGLNTYVWTADFLFHHWPGKQSLKKLISHRFLKASPLFFSSEQIFYVDFRLTKIKYGWGVYIFFSHLKNWNALFSEGSYNFFTKFLLLTKTIPQEATKLFVQSESTFYYVKFWPTSSHISHLDRFSLLGIEDYSPFLYQHWFSGIPIHSLS